MTEIDNTQAAIIATIILFPDRVDQVNDSVDEHWFTGPYLKAYRYISETGGSDPVSLAAAIGVDYSTISEWMDVDFKVGYLGQHIVNLELEANKRKIKYLGKQLTRVDTVDEAMSLIERFNTSFGSIDKTDAVDMRQGLRLFTKELDRRYRLGGKLLGMTYGLSALDEKTEGLQKGDLVVVAAPSSSGKTAFVTGVIEAAAKDGARVLFFSCEMTVEQVLMRSVSSASGVNLGNIRSAKLQPSDFNRITEAAGRMSEWPILIDDAAGISLAELTRKVKRHHKNGLDLVAIDYLQIMTYDKSKENQELDTITTALKNLAKELNVCIIVLSQLNRGSEKEKRKPTMTDLRGSGMIENNADVILFPWREATNCIKCQNNVNDAEHNTREHQMKAEILIGKQRQGERNVAIKVVWIGERTKFVNLAKVEND